MIVIGITGPIGHGKSTLASAFLNITSKSEHLESSMVITEVANEWLDKFPKELLINERDTKLLNRWMKDLADIVSKQLRPLNSRKLLIEKSMLKTEPEMYKQLFVYIDLLRQGVVPIGEKIDQDNKDKHRAILQWVGGYLVAKAHKGIWYEEIEKRLGAAEKRGVQLFIVGGIRYPYDAEVIRRNGGVIIQLLRKDLPERETEDITEIHRHEVKIDATIYSDASREALSEAALSIYDDIQNKTLLKQYNTDDFQGIV
ncbi:MAG: hypothetical protein R3313_04180 [Candidatus Saccharimonadales bacterium]|nr:hypothetical protein [Candidatus Saccharimonadales bacterium]